MSKTDTPPRPDKRLREFEKKNKSFLDGLDALGIDIGGRTEAFVMPYTTRPSLPSRGWKLTDNA